MSESPTHPDAPRAGGETPPLDPSPSSTNYQAHFNKVVGNYAEAILCDRGGEWHQRAARSVDLLEREYSLAAWLFDHVMNNLCCQPIESAYMTGEDWRAVAVACKERYPMLAEQIDQFVEMGGFDDAG